MRGLQSVRFGLQRFAQAPGDFAQAVTAQILARTRAVGARAVGRRLQPNASPQTEVPLDLLAPLPLWSVRLYITSRCNLRCTYCSVSQPYWVHDDMAGDLIDQAVSELADLSSKECVVNLNGHGETTFVDDWEIVAGNLLSQGLTLAMTTNLAKAYTDEEITILSRFKSLIVSVDTFDDVLLKDVRRKVRATTIRSNINAIRECAIRHGNEPPTIQFSCGLFDKNTMMSIGDYANEAVALKVSDVTFWNLYKHPDLPDAVNLYSLDSLSGDELIVRMKNVAEAIQVLRANKVGVHVAGEFVNVLLDRCGLPRV
jgi:MoaA/NifB/PqqE/SkfB family radical SAM enzyme